MTNPNMNNDTIEAEIPVEGGKIVPTLTDPIPNSIQALVGSEQFESAMSKLASAEVGASITGGYREFNTPGVSVRAIFSGMTQNYKYEIDPKTKMQVRREFLGARFVSDDGMWINSGKTLVDAVRNLAPGTPVLITFIGEKDNKNSPGKTKIFDVKKLNISGQQEGQRTMNSENVKRGMDFVDSFIVNDGKVYTKDGEAVTPKHHNQITASFSRIVAELYAIGYNEVATAISANIHTDADRLAQTKIGLKTLEEHFATENIEVPF